MKVNIKDYQIQKNILSPSEILKGYTLISNKDKYYISSLLTRLTGIQKRSVKHES